MDYQTYRDLIAAFNAGITSEQLMAEYGYLAGCTISKDSISHAFDIIAAAASHDVKALAEAAGISVRKLALSHGVPYRTLQGRVAGGTARAEYLVELLGYAIIGSLGDSADK